MGLSNKVPMTVNGQRLQKEYPSRWELVDNTTVPHHAYQLLDYFGDGANMQVDCVCSISSWATMTKPLARQVDASGLKATNPKRTSQQESL